MTMTTTTMRRRRGNPPLLPLGAALIITLALLASTCSARRGAVVRDGMTSKRAYDNPLFEGQDGTLDADVVAITSRCAKWSFDPLDCRDLTGPGADVARDALSRFMRRRALHVTFRSKALAGGRRPNWMRASAALGGDPAGIKGRLSRQVEPLRAVWTCSNPDADADMTYDETNVQSGRSIKKEVGKDVLEDGYEDCLKRLYGKYVELEVLLPPTKAARKHGRAKGGPPPSVVYRVPIQAGHVNPLGMVSKCRAAATLYPNGRTLAAANASGPGAKDVPRDEAIPLGLTNVHVPLGPGLVDPGWSKGRKVFWGGRSVGLV
ncbi:hypothetical protein ACHAWF_011595 [Thalassiosira exigua]